MISDEDEGFTNEEDEREEGGSGCCSEEEESRHLIQKLFKSGIYCITARRTRRDECLAEGGVTTIV